MRTLVVIVVLLGVAYAAPKRLAPLEPATGQVVNDEYIVIFNERATDELVKSHHQKLAAVLAQYNNTQLRVMNQYHIGSFRGYSAHLNDRSLEMVREEMIVKYIEHNQVVTAYQGQCISQQGAPWGLARTSNDLPKTPGSVYTYSDSGSGLGVEVYIIDTGIRITHSEFDGRAAYGYNAVDGREPNDGNGHGTHVAGTVMGITYGLAKKAVAIAVKVLSDSGFGTTDGVIDGINWVAAQHSTGKKSVANMSLGGGRSTALNAAVESAAEKGVAFSLSAGNNGGDACANSPASANVMAVAASDENDLMASFSDEGSCVDVIAPGVDVLSAWYRSDTDYNTISGTSMAAPHVAGVMAMILTEKDLSPSELEREIVALAKDGMIGNIKRPSEQPNKLLHLKCER